MINIGATRKTKGMQVALMILAMLTMSCKKQEDVKPEKKYKLRIEAYSPKAERLAWWVAPGGDKKMGKRWVYQILDLDTTLYVPKGTEIFFFFDSHDCPECKESLLRITINDSIIAEGRDQKNFNYHHKIE